MPNKGQTCRVRRDIAAPPDLDEEAPGYWARDGSLPLHERDEHVEVDSLDNESNLSVMALHRHGVPDNWVNYIAQYPEGRQLRYQRYLMEQMKADRRENRVRMNQKLAELARRRRGIPDDGQPVNMAELRGLVDNQGGTLPQLVLSLFVFSFVCEEFFSSFYKFLPQVGCHTSGLT